jgi:deoxynucleoside triphosphate triphosphohydrolase SAMHD1
MINSIFFKKANIFRDVIHDTITTTVIASAIINSTYFQRLRYLQQLGVCFLVFPTANNKRFEHSIGTYHLVEKLLINIINNSDIKEINNSLLKVPFIKNYILSLRGTKDLECIDINKDVLLDNYLIELIKIAGLCHDLGHGPLSHLFDEWLLTQDDLRDNVMVHHENRSVRILQEIINTTWIGDKLLKDFIDNNAFKFIAELINPTKDTPQNFIFQIVSNNTNGLDVDKLDYICRDSFYLGLNTSFQFTRVITNVKVINDNICFPEKNSYDILKIFRTRYDLHKQFYNHKTVICIELFIKKILDRLDSLINIKSVFFGIDGFNVDRFNELTDATIFNTTTTLLNFTSECISDATIANIMFINNILKNINSRNLYKNVYFKVVSVIENINEEDEINEFIKNNPNYNKNDLIPVTIKIGYLSGNKNHPFDYIYFYDKKDNCRTLSLNSISLLTNETYQEKLFFIVYTNNIY